jgi:uncharacterized protein (DUF427 family)
VRAGQIEIANSRRALLLVRYGPGGLPTYCLPAEDVRTDLFHPSGPRDGFVVSHDVRAGDVTVDAAAQLFHDPPEPLAVLDGHWTFTWDAGVSWFEEAEEVHVHARDPNKRVDAIPSERHVVVEVDGEIIADSRRPHALFETSLPTRWYLPLEDVRRQFLVPSETTSRCPYKGTASYWSVRVGDNVHPDMAWFYPDPIPENPRIAGLVAFFNERVNLVIDGVPQDRPRSPWST